MLQDGSGNVGVILGQHVKESSLLLRIELVERVTDILRRQRSESVPETTGVPTFDKSLKRFVSRAPHGSMLSFIEFRVEAVSQNPEPLERILRAGLRRIALCAQAKSHAGVNPRRFRIAFQTSGDLPRFTWMAPDKMTKLPWRSYKERIANLATRLVEAQRPIRILDQIKWSPDTYLKFRESGFKEPPRVDATYYADRPLGYDAQALKATFQELVADIERELGSSDAIGSILGESATEYVRVIEMLEARGTPRFYELSRELYGSARDVFKDGVTHVRDLSRDLYQVLTELDDSILGPSQERTVSAEDAVSILQQRFEQTFGQGTIRVMLDDGIVVDAAAGSDYVKVRTGAMFKPRDIRILEVHEGWAHVATSLNGQAQRVSR